MDKRPLQDFAEAYLTRYNPVKNHIRSFDRAILVEIPHLIKMRNNLVYVNNGVSHQITFTDVTVIPPTFLDSVSRTVGFYPEEAQLRSMTYLSNIKCTATYTVDGKVIQVLNDYLLASIPCMVGSALCNRSLNIQSATDHKIPDGCFIIRGSLKIIPPLKRANWNVPLVKRDRDSSHLTLEIRSCHESRQSFSTYNTSVILMNSGDKPLLDKKLFVHLSFFVKKKNIACVILFQALGWNPRDAFYAIRFMAGTKWNNQMSVLVRTLLSDQTIPKHENEYNALPDEEKELLGPFDPVKVALDIIIECSARSFDTYEKNVEFALRGLSNELLPQVGIPECNDGDDTVSINHRKGLELASYVSRLILVDLGISDVDCRDHFTFCRMDSVGTLVASLFRQVYSQFLKQGQTGFKKQIEKQGDLNITKIIGNGKITARISYCFSTGSWGSRRSSCKRRNVSQPLQKFNAQSLLGHSSRFYTTRNTEGKHVTLRQIHPSHAFKLCPAATPEGKQCGLVPTGVAGFMLSCGSSASLLTKYIITHKDIVRIQDWRQLCLHLGIEAFEMNDCGYTPIRINGTCIGFLNRGETTLKEFYDWFCDKRRHLDIDPFSSMSYSIDSIDMFCDRDRVVRFVVKISEIPRLKQFIEIHPSPIELISEGLGIILDANEEKNISICASLDYHNVHMCEYVEVDPSCMLSILAGNIPFCNYNQAPRNTYQVSMGKAACGRSLDRQIMLKQRYELGYAQSPLTDTMISRAFHPVFRNFGINCNIAIKMHNGYPQEDSAVVNRASLERGLMGTSHTRMYKDLSRRGSAADRQFYGRLNPKTTSGMKTSNYNKISSTGLPEPGEIIEDGDVVISKADRKGKSDRSQFRCTSILHSGKRGRVENTICTYNSDAQAVRKVTIRSERMPQIGDKISSRHGQKTTIGFIENAWDMPFDPNTGMSPDLIISSTALPSRMTIGMWQEIATSTLAAFTGEIEDATPFRSFDKERIAKEFKLLGMESPCAVRLRDGKTGRLSKCKIYTGLVYIQVLKQFSADKLHARARGPRDILTRAPLEGRSRDGGQRIGYMERDAIFSYGAPSVIHSRMLLHSDVSTEHFCKKCGFQAIANVTNGIYSCKQCGPEGQVREVTMSRAAAVMIQEMAALHISARLQLKDNVVPTPSSSSNNNTYSAEVMRLLDSVEIPVRQAPTSRPLQKRRRVLTDFN